MGLKIWEAHNFNHDHRIVAQENKPSSLKFKMIDFIFNVDFSTVYIILRRDFVSTEDETGVTSMPLGAGFYYSAEDASQAARQYCLREAAKGLDHTSGSACHGQKDGMYWGGCITKEPERDRFEIWVRKLKAKGGRLMSSHDGGDGEARAQAHEVRGSRDRVVTISEDERWSRGSSSLSSRLTGSRAGRMWDSLRRR